MMAEKKVTLTTSDEEGSADPVVEFRYQDDLIISETDKKEYRHLLLGNGLRVLLIRDPHDGAASSESATSAHQQHQQHQPHLQQHHRRQQQRERTSESDSDSDGGGGRGRGRRFSDSSASESTGDEDDRDDRDRHGGGGGFNPASARRSAAALSVGSGSADEGTGPPGLAHWLEHMVFMGSAKYPQENDFDAYVSERGGEANAWTDMEQTLFHFDCRQESFAECLDRFANFFVEPLLSADSLEREVQSVHSEFEEACCSLQSQLEYFIGCLATTGHPLAGFKWGNRKSLWDLPRSAKLDCRALLQEFRVAHYRAGNMTAALQSRMSLDEMEAAARSAFDGLPAGPRVAAPAAPLPDTPAFGDQQFNGRVYCLLPVKQVDRLRIAWSCPPVRGQHETQPHRIIGFCLAHEGPGSLADCLRREGLGVDLVAGVHTASGLCDNSWASLMEITVKLTPKGLIDWRRVVGLVHTYIGMLGGRLEELRGVFEELHGVERAAFRFEEDVEPVDNVETVCVNMQRLPRRLWLLGDERLPRQFDLDGLRRYWGHLRPGNSCVLLASRSFEAACDRVTDWFEMRYSELTQDAASLADWERCVASPDPELLAQYQLHLPPPNPFIAVNFVVPTPEAAYGEVGMATVPEFPIRLFLGEPRLDRFGMLYYYKDRKFATPRAVVRVSLESPVVCESVKSSALAAVWLHVLNFQLHRDAYAANEAGLSYEIVPIEPFSIVIDLEGFNDKLFILYSTILDKWSQIGSMLEARDPALKFDSAREEVRKVLANQLFSAKRLASNLRHYLLEQDRHLASDQLASLESLTVEDLADFHRRLTLKAFFRVYVHGNCGPEEAKVYFRRTLDLLRPDSEVSDLRNTCIALPKGRSGVRVLNLRKGDVNSHLVEEVQFKYPPTLREQVLADVLLHIMCEPCFDFLRTKHQLGYSVACVSNRRHGTLSFHITVASQADKCGMDRLQLMVDKFCAHFAERTLRNLSAAQFANFIRAVTDQKLAEDSAMTDEANRYWEEIEEGEFMFDRRLREAQLLGELMMVELPSFYERAMVNDRRSFTVQVEGTVTKAVHSGGTAEFSLPLTYLMTVPTQQQQQQSTKSYTRSIAYTKDLKDLKAGMKYNCAKSRTGD